MKKKWIRYIVWTVVAIIGIWIVFLGIAFLYIKTNKDKIIASVKSDISKKISARFEFSDLTVDFFQNFPGLSIDLENVSLQDSLFPVHKKELLRLKHVYISLGVFNLFSRNKEIKEVILSNGNITLFADTGGSKNWMIMRTQPGEKKPFDLKKIVLKNVNAVFQDKSKFKYYQVWFERLKCNIHSNQANIRFEMNNRSVLKIISFNTRVGSYLTNKKMSADWNLYYDRKTKTLALKNQVTKINGQSYRLTGNFVLKDNPSFHLDIQTNNLSLKEAASIFPKRTQTRMARFTLSKSLKNVHAELEGPMKYLSLPLAKVNFSVDDASLAIDPVNFEHCSFNGSFKNEVVPGKTRDDRNSYLQFSAVRGQWEKNKFEAKDVSIYDLISPYLKCEVHFSFSLSLLEKAIASQRLDFNSGTGEATLNYAGPLVSKDTLYDLSGKISIHDGDITYNPRNLHFKKTDVELVFKEGDMQVNKMNTEINTNKIRITGKVAQLVNFFNSDASKARFDWNIYSPELNLGELRSSLHRTATAKEKHGYSFLTRLNNKIDKLFDDCNAYLQIQADKLIYKNFMATNVKGNLSLTNYLIQLDNFSLTHAGGLVSANASLKDNGNNSDLTLQSKLQNVDVKELLRAFNNFGMESLTSKNISGSFSANINLTSMLDANNDLNKQANKGYVDFSLKNGRLENFRPLMDIDNNFLQKRDLSDVSFAELKDRFELNGNDIQVNRMEIRSTAVNLYVEGIYSFANNTDLSIQVPLHGQKKDQQEAPERKGNNSKTGMSIFLRARDDKEGKLKISYDLLGRFRNNSKSSP